MTPTAANRARTAPDQSLEHQREVALARHKRARARNIRLALVSAVILAVVLAFGFYKGVPTLLSSARPAANSVDPFVTSRVGRVQTWNERDGCRQFNFDNKTGTMSSLSTVPCYGIAAGSAGASSPQSRNRLEAISDAFRR